MDGRANRNGTAFTWSRWIGIAVLAWLAVGTLNWLGRNSYTSQAVIATTAAIVVLGYLVWRLSGSYPWPNEPRLRFFLGHTGLAFVFVALLLTVLYLTQSMTTGKTLGAVLRESRLLRWELLLGLWLYALIVGSSYTQRLRERLLHQDRAAEEAKALATSAQLTALRAQLHPHFLFNALHSINALVPEDSRAAEAVERLGFMLRYALDREDDGGGVPLSEEWDFTQNYLELERLGLGPRLRVVEQIDSNALETLVPPFTLQTLVENAVRHGPSAHPEGGDVVIRVGICEGTLELSVENDMVPGNDLPKRTSGHGLRLLSQRLDVSYGTLAGLDVKPVNGRFLARVRIPIDSDAVPRLESP